MEKALAPVMNIQRLAEKGKKDVVCSLPSQTFVDVKDGSEWDAFIGNCPDELRRRIQKTSSREKDREKGPSQLALL
jgi:hypothetical protein